MAFATVDELASFLQTTFTAEQQTTAQLQLDIATARVITVTGELDRVTGAEFRLYGDGRVAIRLPHAPAIPVSVTSVVVDDTTLDASEYRLSRINTIERTDRAPWFGEIVVTYDYGFAAGEIPDDIKGATLAEAGELMRNPARYQSVRLGDAQFAFTSTAAGELPPHLSLLDRYKADALGRP